MDFARSGFITVDGFRDPNVFGPNTLWDGPPQPLDATVQIHGICNALSRLQLGSIPLKSMDTTRGASAGIAHDFTKNRGKWRIRLLFATNLMRASDDAAPAVADHNFTAGT